MVWRNLRGRGGENGAGGIFKKFTVSGVRGLMHDAVHVQEQVVYHGN